MKHEWDNYGIIQTTFLYKESNSPILILITATPLFKTHEKHVIKSLDYVYKNSKSLIGRLVKWSDFKSSVWPFLNSNMLISDIYFAWGGFSSYSLGHQNLLEPLVASLRNRSLAISFNFRSYNRVSTGSGNNVGLICTARTNFHEFVNISRITIALIFCWFFFLFRRTLFSVPFFSFWSLKKRTVSSRFRPLHTDVGRRNNCIVTISMSMPFRYNLLTPNSISKETVVGLQLNIIAWPSYDLETIITNTNMCYEYGRMRRRRHAEELPLFIAYIAVEFEK